jgi:hypothetical protein
MIIPALSLGFKVLIDDPCFVSTQAAAKRFRKDRSRSRQQGQEGGKVWKKTKRIIFHISFDIFHLVIGSKG